MSKNKSEKLNKMYFSPLIAEEVGVDEAIMYHNIKFWCEKNAENGSDHHFHEGVYWMFNSVKSFQKSLSFWSESQIKRILKNLIKAGYIKRGCFNRIGYDKTSWYTVLVKEKESAEIENSLDRKELSEE